MEYLDGMQACQPRFIRQVHDWLRNAQRQIWPTICVLCRGRAQSALDLCEGCRTDLRLNPVACARCAVPLHHSDAAALCGRCLQRLPYFDRSIVPFAYAYPLDHLIRGLKYSGRLSYGRVCGTLFAQICGASGLPLPELLIPVPLGERRYRIRGYNQAHEIARAMSRVLAIPVRMDLVQRVRETTEQAGLKRKERRRNVRGAFAVSKELDARRVAIVDDVVTTGSTVNEIARVLRRAGAEHVEVWAIARA